VAVFGPYPDADLVTAPALRLARLVAENLDPGPVPACGDVAVDVGGDRERHRGLFEQRLESRLALSQLGGAQDHFLAQQAGLTQNEGGDGSKQQADHQADGDIKNSRRTAYPAVDRHCAECP
jgi:hypothetical protein